MLSQAVVARRNVPTERKPQQSVYGHEVWSWGSIGRIHRGRLASHQNSKSVTLLDH